MDLSKLREQDVPYVTEVVDYLKEQGLEVELTGSVLQGDKKYQDVDLLARGSSDAVASATSGIERSLDAPNPFPQQSADGLEYQVIHLGGPIRYIGTLVDERFNIQVGETNIDLNLEAVLKFMDTSCDGELDFINAIDPYFTKMNEKK